MSLRALLLLPAVIFAAAVPAAEIPAAASPLLPPAATIAPTAAPASGTARWELVAIMGTREFPAVRIRDTESEAAAWLGVGESFGALKVVSADLTASTATVQVGNQRLVLPLRLAGVAPGTTAAANAPAAGANGNPTTGTTTAAPAPLPSTADAAADAKRDQEIAEREARMLVSDLLEISMIQQKAYAEKQAEAAKAAGTAP
jgi:hypothetical protein